HAARGRRAHQRQGRDGGMVNPATGAAPPAAPQPISRLETWLRALLSFAMFTLAMAVLAWLVAPGAAQIRASPIAATSAIVILAATLVTMASAAKSPLPARMSWIAVNGVVLAAGVAALVLVPPWSGLIVAALFVSLVVAPNVLVLLAYRCAAAGRAAAAAAY